MGIPLSFALDGKLSKDLRERLTEAKGAADEASHLTSQLLTFAKGGDPVVRTLKLPRILRDSMNFALRGTTVSGELVIDDGLWSVDVDQGQLSQVIQNLVINASQAMPNGGTITISAENLFALRHPSLPKKDGRFVHVAITDTGVGISPENIKKIFDPYFTTKQDGHGLGLASTLSIIRKHHGQLGVNSEPGKGTTFSIYLPANEVPRDEATGKTKLKASRKTPKARAPKDRQYRILVMDDELLIRTSTSLLLKKLGYDTVTAEHGKDALQVYQNRMGTPDAIDLVLMDLTIPGGMGGKEAVSALMQLDPNAKAIVFSGYSNDQVMANFTRYGFCDAIHKPFQPDHLARIIEKHLTAST